MNKYLHTILLFFLSLLTSFALRAEVLLSTDVYRDVSFSDQYAQAGAFTRNVNFAPVKKLIEQLNNLYGLSLTSRGEAHITVITPPEYKGWGDLIKMDELISRFSESIQNTEFKVVCVGHLKNTEKEVFYLVVDSLELYEFREEIQKELEARAKLKERTVSFKAYDYYPHITIGFINDDIHNLPKDPETCVQDLIFIK